MHDLTGTPMGPDEAQSGRLRLLSFNIHAATSTDRFHHYVTHSWRQILPHNQRTRNLDSIAGLVQDYDMVALQEADAGSLRSGFINQSRYIASHSGMPYWFHQANRKLGSMTFTSNGFLARFVPHAVEEHRLPGAIPGRGALLLRYGVDSELVIVVVHLALGRRARTQQLDYLARCLEGQQRMIVMGDFNSEASSAGVADFCARLGLNAPTDGLASYPSWQPQRAIDHILVSRNLVTEEVCVVDVPMSDHCPVALTVRIPEGLGLGAPELAADSLTQPQASRWGYSSTA
jgi:endonuclease/exonuclease/phosphatase family metal-dependent hydrolase